MTNLYNKVSERLWEKLEAYRDKINIDCVDFSKPFPIDQLEDGNPLIRKLIDEVQEEFNNYSMSEFQCSWATHRFIKGGLIAMEEYNQANNTNLKPRK